MINALRLRQQKNAVAILFVSQGVPMLYMGDECGRTQRGNNNAYCQDEDWNWFDWSLTAEYSELLRFVKGMIAFRRANPALRQAEFLNGRDCIGSGYPDISWHGVQPWKPDWSLPSRSIAFLLCGRHGAAIGGPPHFIYCGINMFHEPLDFTLPVLPKGMEWYRVADTSLAAPEDIAEPGAEVHLAGKKVLTVNDRTTVILIGR
jgi:glycogen operon protein